MEILHGNSISRRRANGGFFRRKEQAVFRERERNMCIYIYISNYDVRVVYSTRYALRYNRVSARQVANAINYGRGHDPREERGILPRNARPRMHLTPTEHGRSALDPREFSSVLVTSRNEGTREQTDVLARRIY